MSKKGNKKGNQDRISTIALLAAITELLIKLIELIEKLIE